MGRSEASIGGAPFGAVVPAPAGYLPPYVRAVIDEAARPRSCRSPAPGAPHDPRTPALVAVVRDEAARLPGFLAHYRRLGVTRFAMIDNGSPDATRALLAAEPDVELYAADRPFPGKQGWVNALIARMGYDRWYLHVDADERLVFDGARAPGRPGRGLADLVGFAEARGLRRLRGMLVDLYPPGPLARAGGAGAGRCSRRRRGPAVRRRRLRRGALPRAHLAQGRAAAARLRLRPRAHQVPAVPRPRRRGGVEPAPPAPLPRELPLGLLPRAPARQVRPGLRRQGRARRRRAQLLAAAASSTARRSRRSPATPASRSPTPAAGATARPPTWSPPG